MRIYITIFIFILTSYNLSFGQGKKLFTVEEFIQLIKQNHPVAKQANLQVKMAEAELLAAKGGFDPVIAMTADRKTFDGKNYYFHTNPEIKIPTPIGVDFKTGAESNGGNNLSSELTGGRSSYA
ncbi:MAG: TolC family protein, partial [Chitinophagaceae bacterium]|nr:TolC family protein [Chitinophagaceae bacterium]